MRIRRVAVVYSKGRPLWLTSLAAASFFSIVFGLIHVADAIVRGESGQWVDLDATLNPLYAVIYLAGVALSWNGRRVGYVMLLILSALSGYGFFGHTTSTTPASLAEIGQRSGVFFVLVVLLGAVASVSTFILSTYAIIAGRTPKDHERQPV